MSQLLGCLEHLQRGALSMVTSVVVSSVVGIVLMQNIGLFRRT
jgi:hypothetical protein